MRANMHLINKTPNAHNGPFTILNYELYAGKIADRGGPPRGIVLVHKRRAARTLTA